MNMSKADFTTEWLKEAHITEQVMNALTDDSLKTAMTEQHRTLGQLAWHLVMSIQYMTMLGLQFEGPSREQKFPIRLPKLRTATAGSGMPFWMRFSRSGARRIFALPVNSTESLGPMRHSCILPWFIKRITADR